MGDLYLDLDKTEGKMVSLDKFLVFLVVDKKVGLDLDKLLGVKDLKIVDMVDAISSIVQESV